VDKVREMKKLAGIILTAQEEGVGQSDFKKVFRERRSKFAIGSLEKLNPEMISKSVTPSISLYSTGGLSSISNAAGTFNLQLSPFFTPSIDISNSSYEKGSHPFLFFTLSSICILRVTVLRSPSFPPFPSLKPSLLISLSNSLSNSLSLSLELSLELS